MTIARRNLSLPDIPRSQLRAEWRFVDYGDATLRDWSGGGRNMAINGPTWSAAGLTFNGTSAYAGAAGAGVATFSSTTTFSAIAAIRVTTAASSTVIGGTGSSGIQIFTDSTGKFAVNKANVINVGTANTTILNRWAVVGVSYDGTTIRFYLNGMPDGSGTNVQNFSVQNSYIGKRNNAGTEFFGGEMAYILAYDRVLTQPEHAYAAQNIARHIGLLPAIKVIRPWGISSGGTTYDDAGSATSILVGSGADVATFADAGSATSILAGSGTDTAILLDSGTAASVFVGSGADAATFADSGSATSILVGSGADAPEYADTGTGVLLGVGSGADTPAYSDTGTGLAALFGSGADIAILIDSGGGVLVAIGSGADNAPAPPAILPYVGDTTIYDLDSPTGSITGGTVLDSEYIYDS